jgi:DNA-binding IclR family transcriptional regulator
MEWDSSPVALSLDVGGKDFADAIILKWLYETGASNTRLLMVATGLPVELLETLLGELVRRGYVRYTKGFGGWKIYHAVG